MKPFTMTLTPGPNPADAAIRAAKYVINEWMPNNAGGIHTMVTPKLAVAFLNIYEQAKGPVKVRVSLENNIPLLAVL